jgi:hypothetical protein
MCLARKLSADDRAAIMDGASVTLRVSSSRVGKRRLLRKLGTIATGGESDM